MNKLPVIALAALSMLSMHAVSLDSSISGSNTTEDSTTFDISVNHSFKSGWFLRGEASYSARDLERQALSPQKVESIKADIEELLPNGITLDHLADLAKHLNWPQDPLEEVPDIGITDQNDNLLNHSIIDHTVNSNDIAECGIFNGDPRCHIKFNEACDGYDRYITGYISPIVGGSGYSFYEERNFQTRSADIAYGETEEEVAAEKAAMVEEARKECFTDAHKDLLGFRYRTERIDDSKIPQPNEDGKMPIIGCLIGLREEGCDRADNINKKIKELNDLREKIEDITKMSLDQVLDQAGKGMTGKEIRVSIGADFGYRFNMHEKVDLLVFSGISANQLKIKGDGNFKDIEYSDSFRDYKVGAELGYLYADNLSLRVKTEKHFKGLQSAIDNTYISENIDYSVEIINSYRLNKNVSFELNMSHTAYANDFNEGAISLGARAYF